MRITFYFALLLSVAGYHGLEAKGHSGTTNEYDDYKVRVSCGCHYASSCSHCGTQESLCNGDCTWNGSGCTLKGFTASPTLASDTSQSGFTASPTLSSDTSRPGFTASPTLASDTSPSGECGNAHEATLTISRGIYTYRSYFNHYKMINRTTDWIDTIENKTRVSKLIEYDKAAVYLKRVTEGGTYCSRDTSLSGNVMAIVAKLTQCGNEINGNIVHECNPNNIPDFTESWPKQKQCAIEYDLWINDFTTCFGHLGAYPSNYPTIIPPAPITCSCYADLNDNGAVSNSIPQSCAFPNYDHSSNHVDDWIKIFNKETNVVLTKCKKEVTTCNEFISEAFKLATECC